MRSSNQWLINLSKDELLWAKNLATLPSMIHFEYMQLKNLAAQGQVYGVLLQCKDTYETVLRIPVIMALVVIDSDPKYKDGSEYNDIMKAFLESPMSMGNWNNLARVIIKNNKKLNLPENLIKILEKTRKLYNTEITDKVSDVVAWRNDTIGHGALKFEGDSNYQEEVKSLLNLLKEYFDGEGKLSIKGLYDSIYFQCSENKLVGDCYDKNAEHDLILHIAGSAFNVSNYINDCNLKWYLFESFYCRKNLVKYSSYIDGKNNTVQNKYFSDLYEKHVLQGNKDAAVASDYISRAEDLILEYLNMPTDYVNPEKLVELLQEQMDALGKGVITIFMERGTGKSAFANQMSGLYHSKPLLKNTLSRCYHVSNAALRGVSDFTNSITNGFRHSFNPADDLWGSTEELPSLTLESENPAEDMAVFLNFYHDKYRKDYTILVIDGIDETTEQSEFILNYIPSKERLDEGVFVVLTTRFSDEKTVQGKSKKYIEKATQLADEQLEIRRHEEINTELLKRYIEKHKNKFGLNNSIDKEALIKKSDYRILYLRAYLAMKDKVALDSTNETTFIESYMNYLLSFYGINQKQKLKEIAVSIALFPSISIKKYQEYLNCQEITYEFVGLFNDLLPVLTVVHLDGEDCYEFADAAYEDFVIDSYPDVVKDVVHYFNDSFNHHLGEYLRNGRRIQSDGTTKDKGDNKLNEKIMFFSEGLLNIWHKSKYSTLIYDLFFSNLNILALAYQLIKDEWANIGYGFIIKREIINVLGEGLNSSLQTKSGTTCKTWLRKICKELNKNNWCYLGRGDFFGEELKRMLFETSGFTALHEYLISNYKSIKNIKQWFWALIAFGVPNKILEIIREKREEFSFAIYMGYSSRDNLENLFGSVCSPKAEEQVLNYLILHYYGKKDIEKIKRCISIIEEKGYALQINNKILKFLNKPPKNKNSIKMVNNKIKKACKILLNYSFPLNNSTLLNEVVDTVKLTHHNYSYNWNNNPIRFKDLYNAFYQRLCFEKKNGNLEYFVESISNYFAVCGLPVENLIRDIIDANLTFAHHDGFPETFFSGLWSLGGLIIYEKDEYHDEYDDEGVRVLSPFSQIDLFEEPVINSLEAEPFINDIPVKKLFNYQRHIEVSVMDVLEVKGLFNSYFEVDTFINQSGRIEFTYRDYREKEVLQLIMYWIKELKQTNYAKNKYTNLLLFILMTVPIEYEDYKDVTQEEPPLTLEELVYTTDTCAFLFWCLKYCSTPLFSLNKIQDLHGHIYCTDNTLLLLREYFENGKIEQFNYLLSAMEETIPIIDKNLVTNHLTEAMCEIQKYRFLNVRKKYGFSNDFDQYIINGVYYRIKKIEKIVKELTTDEDFVDLAYNIELVLEFAWQTREWKEGYSYCRLFINLLNEKVSTCTYLLAESLKEEILIIENCKRFFSLLANEKDEALNPKIPMISLYKQLSHQVIATDWGSGPRVEILFDAISDIQRIDFEDENHLRDFLNFKLKSLQ